VDEDRETDPNLSGFLEHCCPSHAMSVMPPWYGPDKWVGPRRRLQDFFSFQGLNAMLLTLSYFTV
jgi:hypothetical protein